MTYGETSQVKTDYGLGATYDARLTDWDAKASSEWDDLLYRVAKDRRLITQLPELPLATGEVTETDKDGTNHLIIAKYYDTKKQFEAAKHHREEALRIAEKRVERIGVDRRIYGRVIR